MLIIFTYLLFTCTLHLILGKIRIDKKLKGDFSLVQPIYRTIKQYLYHPLLLVFIIPLSYLLAGTLYAGQYTQFSFIRFILLYGFVFINHLLGNFLFKTAKITLSFNHISFIVFELINLLLIYYFSSAIHSLVGLLCFFYSVVIHAHFYLIRQGYTWVTLAISSIFKGGILTYLSFYVQANFIPTTLFYWSTPLILVVFLVELGKIQLNYPMINVQLTDQQTNTTFLDTKKFNRFLLGLLLLIYLISFIFYIPTFKGTTFIILFTLPFAIKLIQYLFSKEELIAKKLKQRALQLYSVAFFISFSVILFIHTN